MIWTTWYDHFRLNAQRPRPEIPEPPFVAGWC